MRVGSIVEKVIEIQVMMESSKEVQNQCRLWKLERKTVLSLLFK